MLHRFENQDGEEIFVAGQRAMPGHYRMLETGRAVVLEHEDVLPASLDGRIACYVRVDNSWAQVADQKAAAH